jgi:hypothetical protein
VVSSCYGGLVETDKSDSHFHVVIEQFAIGDMHRHWKSLYHAKRNVKAITSAPFSWLPTRQKSLNSILLVGLRSGVI